MHNHTGDLNIDPELHALRLNMQDKICKWLEKKQPNQSSEWRQRLPDLAKKLEESIFKESLNKEDYISKFQSGIEMRVANMLNQLRQNHLRQQQLHQQQLQQQNHQQTMVHHNIQSNCSASGMMIPTPGITQTGTMRISSALESNQENNPSSMPTDGTLINHDEEEVQRRVVKVETAEGASITKTPFMQHEKEGQPPQGGWQWPPPQGGWQGQQPQEGCSPPSQYGNYNPVEHYNLLVDIHSHQWQIQEDIASLEASQYKVEEKIDFIERRLAREIAEERAFREELRERNKRQDEFFAVLANHIFGPPSSSQHEPLQNPPPPQQDMPQE